MNSMATAIHRNQTREARRSRAERILRLIRARIFDYEDMGKMDKAHKVMDTCKRILAPRWQARHHAQMESAHRNYMM